MHFVLGRRAEAGRRKTARPRLAGLPMSLFPRGHWSPRCFLREFERGVIRRTRGAGPRGVCTGDGREETESDVCALL